MPCIFCSIARKELPAQVVYENEDMIAFLDIHPRAPGHCLVIPKHHYETLLEAPERSLCPLFQGVKAVTGALHDVLRPDGFTIGINHGRASGQEVPHLHIHIIPRFRDDGGLPIQGVVYNIPTDTLDVIAEKVRNKLS